MGFYGMELREGLKFRGSSLLRAWESGAIPSLLKNGKLSYREALRIAELWGCCLHSNRVDNLIVNNGIYWIGDFLINIDTVGFAYHAIGTGFTAPAAGDTALTDEVARKPFATQDRALSVLTLSVFYRASECTYNIKEAGIYGGATATATLDSGELFSHFLQSYNNSGGTVDLSWDYDLALSVG